MICISYFLFVNIRSIINMIKSTQKILQRVTCSMQQSFSVRTVGDIEFHEYDSFTKVLLNRPKALNSLTHAMVRTLSNELPSINLAKSVWFEGAGGKSFCAGGDVKELLDPNSTA